jgi:hypothetical protein
VNHDLRTELQQMVEEDQRLRGEGVPPGPSKEQWQQIDEADRRHAGRMREIVDRHGWPGRSLVGEDGAQWAWVLVQHAYHDVPFMRRCLDVMAEAVEAGEASATDYACLYDRVLIHERGEQLYGTHYLLDDENEIVGARLVDPENVDERRREVGLVPLEEHLSRLRAWQTELKAALAEGRQPSSKMPSPRVEHP